MAEWNPLLVAIAYKRIEIVRYLTQELHVSVRQWTRTPNTPLTLENHAFIDAQMFAFKIIVANKDLAMLKELWNVNYIAWEDVHMQRLFKLLIQAKWIDGIKSFFGSYTTDILIATQSHPKQIDSIEELLHSKKSVLGDAASGEIGKVISESLSKSPFLLPYLYVALGTSGSPRELVHFNEIKTLTEKHLTSATLTELAFLKQSILEHQAHIRKTAQSYEFPLIQGHVN